MQGHAPTVVRGIPHQRVQFRTASPTAKTVVRLVLGSRRREGGREARSQELRDRLLQHRMPQIWHKLFEGFQDKPALVQTGVWDDQVGFMNHLVVVQEQIEVNRAWTPSWGSRDAPKLALQPFGKEE